MIEFSKKLAIDGAGYRSERGDPGGRESLRNDPQPEVMVGMSMGHVNRFEMFAGFRYLRDESMGIRQCPLGINQNGIGFPHDDDGSNFEPFFIAEEHLGRQRIRSVVVDSDFHRFTLHSYFDFSLANNDGNTVFSLPKFCGDRQSSKTCVSHILGRL
jgi:hypothetical protein